MITRRHRKHRCYISRFSGTGSPEGERTMKLSISEIFNLDYGIKKSIASTALLALSVTYEMVSKKSRELKDEISSWEDGRTFALGVLKDGPSITLMKKGDRIKYLGKGIQGDPAITIYFKNIDSALMVFIGLIGAHTASVQRRVIVHGDLSKTMEVMRTMNIVQMYLMPGIVLKKTFKRPPELSGKQLALKAQIYAGLVPGLILSGSK